MAYFTESDYENEIFRGLECVEQKISAKTFSNCQFLNSNFSSSDLDKSRFLNCSFVGCNLSNTKPNGCRLQDVHFDSCKMVGVDFTKFDAWIFSVSFSRCLLNLCNFSTLKLSGTSFKSCTLREVDFVEANLAKADFSDCDLRGALFNRTDLRNANFVGAKNYSINPMNNKIQRACFGIPEVLSLLSTFDIKIE